MFSFPSFKSSKNYRLYKQASLERWHSVLIKLMVLIFIQEGCNLIEYEAVPNIEMWQVIQSKLFSWGFYGIATIVRFYVIKNVKADKIKLADRTDWILILLVMVVLGVAPFMPKAPVVSTNAIWITKEALRFIASYLVLSVTFFNWYLGPVIVTLVLLYVVLYWNYYVPGYLQWYLPSFCGIILTILAFGYMFEKIKRNSFEAQMEALGKEKVWKEVLNELPEGVLVVNKERNITYINNAVHNILEFEAGTRIENLETINSHLDISIKNIPNPRQTMPTETSNLMNTLDIGEPTTFLELQSKIWRSWPSMMLSYNNYNIYKGTFYWRGREKTIDIKYAIKQFAEQDVVIFIFSDVSERILVDSLRETIDYKNRLLASVSHELRTPLNGNINFIEAAISDPNVPLPVINKFLTPAVRSAKYLLTIINDILDFSQIQHEKLRLFPTVSPIMKTVKEALELIEVQAKRKKLELTLNTPDPDWDMPFKTDHNRLLQIITNLASNALKFTFQGGITVVVSSPEKKQVCIEVRDTGIGISKKDQEKLFKQFGKINNEKYLNPQGVGLGLVISNELAKRLGPKEVIINGLDESVKEKGGITVESEPDIGSKFSFVIEEINTDQGFAIPRERPSFVEPNLTGLTFQAHKYIISKTSATTANSERKTMLQCDCPKILIADDDAFNLLALENILTSLHITSVQTYNGKQVLDEVKKRMNNPCSEDCRPFGLIFLDGSMPIMDGYECAMHLRTFFKENPKQKGTVVACTAAVQSSERKKALESGMDEFCAKPISKTKIQELIGIYLRDYDQYQEDIVEQIKLFMQILSTLSRRNHTF